MSNDLAVVDTSNTSVAVSNPFTKAAEDNGAQDSGYYMTFSGKFGTYEYGANKDELEVGHRLAIAPNLLGHGWICWNSGAVVEEILIPIVTGQPVPTRASLKDHGPYIGDRSGWNQLGYIHGRSITTGDEFKLKLQNVSGVKAFYNFIKAYGDQMCFHEGEVPIVELGVVQFPVKDKATGKVKKNEFAYAPTFKIVGWKTEAELQEILASNVSGGYDDSDLEPAEEAPPPPARRDNRQTQQPAGRKRNF